MQSRVSGVDKVLLLYLGYIRYPLLIMAPGVIGLKKIGALSWIDYAVSQKFNTRDLKKKVLVGRYY